LPGLAAARPAGVQTPEFRFLQDFLLNEIGFAMGDEKDYLIESRLNPVAAAFGLSSWVKLAQALKALSSSELRSAVCEAMTTNETSFFRDTRPFEALRASVFPRLREQNAAAKTLRIWCAAASTGQEPYSIAMLLADHFPELLGWSLTFLATDISPKVIDRAQKGIFTQFEIQRGLPIQLLLKHFKQKGDKWELSRELRQLVRFEKFNLLDPFHRLPGPFDLILIRNVLIYFNNATKSAIFSKLRAVIQPQGCLFLGGTETVLGHTECFKRAPDGGAWFTPA
jgi:chemotaxis protein methyltransferase CheR